jgi:AbiV family abortive infection protein
VQKEILDRFNVFRGLCLKNARSALAASESLIGKEVNHIVFHLLVLSLEEVGKIFIGWYQLNKTDKWGKESVNIPIDDHVKKLFWAIWGPSFMRQKFTSKQMDQIRQVATDLHEARLESLYTKLDDTVPASLKISDQYVNDLYEMAKARLDMAFAEGDVDTSFDVKGEDDIKWFMELSDNSDKRHYIFGHESQEKLIEFGDISLWIKWLREQFDKEKSESIKLLEKELNKKIGQLSGKPKWKIRFKVNIPSHSLRPGVLNSFNGKNPIFKFTKGVDSHTLLVDLFIDEGIKVQALFNHGFLVSRMLVGAMNVGSNGFCYWNVVVDTDKYYDRIDDLENRKQLVATMSPPLRLDWGERKMVFGEDEISLTMLTFGYFIHSFNENDFEAINDYFNGLAMMAKTDIHLRLETQCFYAFFTSFRKALVRGENLNENDNIADIGFHHIGELLGERSQYDKAMSIGAQLLLHQQLTDPVSLTDVVAMKQYCGLYFIELATRKIKEAHEKK